MSTLNKPTIQVKAPKPPVASTEPTPNTIEVPELAPALFQCYASSRISTQFVTEEGGVIQFTAKQFITKEPIFVAYLDKLIDQGLRDITKGEPVTSANRDPMVQLKEKHFRQFQKELIESAKNKALGITQDMGSTANASNLNALSTSQTAV